jgi:hypothetical protein
MTMTSHLLFHEHPAKGIAEGVGLIVDLIGRSGEVRLCARHLASHRHGTYELLDLWRDGGGAHNTDFWRRF